VGSIIFASVVIVVFAVIVAKLGTAILRRIYRGPRVGEQPFCAICNARLEDGPPDPSSTFRCPACDADLTSSGAIVRGEPTRRPRLTATVIVAAALGLLVLVFTQTAVGAGLLKPLSTSTLVTLTDLNGVAASVELKRRVIENELTDAETASLADAAIKRFRANAAPANSPWERVLLALLESLADAQMIDYAGAAFADGIGMRIPPEIESGGPLVVEVQAASPRLTSRLTFAPIGATVRLRELRVAGVNAPISGTFGDEHELWRSPRSVTAETRLRDVPVGEHDLELVVAVIVYHAPLPNSTGPDTASTAPRRIGSWTVTLHATVRITPPRAGPPT
jgi:hypothetical protein